MLRTSASIELFAPAFVAAQGEITPAPKDKINPHFKSRYADLASIMEACREALKRNGLGVIQSPGFVEGRIRVTTRIVHKSGQWVESDLDLKTRNDTAQDAGSAITYARRYALASMLGVVSEEDDDGNLANGNRSAEPRPLPKRPVAIVFDRNNAVMTAALIKQLEGREIDPHWHDQILQALHGKTMAPGILDQVLDSLGGAT